MFYPYVWPLTYVLALSLKSLLKYWYYFQVEWVVVYEFRLFVAKIEVEFRVSCILRNHGTPRNLNTPRLIPFHQSQVYISTFKVISGKNWPKISKIWDNFKGVLSDLREFKWVFYVLMDGVIFMENIYFITWKDFLVTW